MKKIIIATNNDGKAKEFRDLFIKYDIECLTLKDIGYDEEIIEDGSTFYENALIKAKTISERFNTVCLADDSGLCVESLNNEPGIYSARYLGLDSDEKRTNAVLDKLDNINNRAAKFVCSLVICFSDGENICFNGELFGTISLEPCGTNGFGYDPIFKPNGYELTLAELPFDIKNKISHRRLALNKLMEYINKNDVI